jgi:hypothetical protein
MEMELVGKVKKTRAIDESWMMDEHLKVGILPFPHEVGVLPFPFRKLYSVLLVFPN